MEHSSEREREEGETSSFSRGTYIKWAAGVLLFAAVFFACGFVFARILPVKKADQTIDQVIGLVRSEFYYYGEETEKQLREGALKGIAAYLEDPYACYYTPEEYKALLKTDSGEYVGLGVTVETASDGTCVISAVFENAPAALAGILPGDVLLCVNGTDTAGKDLSGIIGLFYCEEGDVNTLLIGRGSQTLTFTVTAGEVYTPYVRYRMLDERIGYIYISGFHGKVTVEVRTAVETLRAQGMDRLVLDVRDDPGGMLTDVCDIADIFLPADCVITTLKSRTGTENVYRTAKEGMDIPIALLVNGGSASSSELLAGALHDNGAAVLFGTKTYGKGIVQTYYELGKGDFGAFKMTTEAYFTPGGVCIQEAGITPDHVIEMPEGVAYTEICDLSPAEDPQLSAAMEYLDSLR